MDTLGRYKLSERIAIGGMAEIFLAEQPGPAGFSRRVAIKKILPHRADDAEFVEMFLNEARLSALLNHPNIVQIYDLGEADGAYYIAMEFVDGYDLGQILDKCEERRERMAAPFIAKVISQAAAGLNYAHAYCDPQSGQPLNLIHRDISLPNIMMSKEGVIKLLDFGIAKAATTEQRAPTQTGVLKGKISYMSPEYLMGEPIDWRHDLFALGVVMFELATGEKPFQAKGDVQMLQAILTQPPRDPSTLNRSLPRNFVDIVMRMLAKDPHERYQNGSEIQSACEQFVFDSVAGEIPHSSLAEFLGALFRGERLPDPMMMATKQPMRSVHSPPTSNISAFQAQTPVPQSPTNPGSLHPMMGATPGDSGGWMEETRAISLSAAGLPAPTPSGLHGLHGIDDHGPSLTEQTRMLSIDAISQESTMDSGIGGPPAGEPMTRELDISMLPPADMPSEAPLAAASTTDFAQPMAEAEPGYDKNEAIPTATVPPPPSKTPKWLLLLIPMCLVLGVLSVLGWRYFIKKPDPTKPKTAYNDADAAAPTSRDDDEPTKRDPQVQPKAAPVAKKRAPLAKKAPAVPRRPLDRNGAPLPVFAPPDRRADDASPVAPPRFVLPGQKRPVARKKQAAVKPPPNRRYKYGVYLKSYPKAKVFWQGKDWGYTPVEMPMGAGTHNIILRRYRPYIRFPYQITLEEKEYLQKTVYIREGFLDIRVTPWAQVSIDGHYIGRTPLSPIRLYAGYHKLRLVNLKKKKRITRLIVIYGGRKTKIRTRF